MMAAPHSTRHDELMPAYALGALDGGELRELEEHLAAGCAECERQLAAWQGDLEELASSVPPLAPSAETRRRILRLAGPAAGSAPLPFPAREPRRSRLPGWLGLAAAAVLVVAVGGIGSAWWQSREEAGRLRQQVAALDRRITEVQGDNKRLAETLSLITAPGARSVQLAGLGSSPGAAGHTFVNPQERKAIVYAFDLPALAPGKTYQLWWIAAGRPVSAGTFSVDEHGSARILVDQVENVDEIQAWAVTVEPAGGVPQPTGEMVLKG
jgi:anti-sigma-K factor RskA